jgi:cold shock CspA family protein
VGFVEVYGGGKDVFVHISVVEQAQLTSLAEDQRISMRMVEIQKGRQPVAKNIRQRARGLQESESRRSPMHQSGWRLRHAT